MALDCFRFIDNNHSQQFENDVSKCGFISAARGGNSKPLWFQRVVKQVFRKTKEGHGKDRLFLTVFPGKNMCVPYFCSIFLKPELDSSKDKRYDL